VNSHISVKVGQPLQPCSFRDMQPRRHLMACNLKMLPTRRLKEGRREWVEMKCQLQQPSNRYLC